MWEANIYNSNEALKLGMLYQTQNNPVQTQFGSQFHACVLGSVLRERVRPLGQKVAM